MSASRIRIDSLSEINAYTYIGCLSAMYNYNAQLH